MIMIGSNNNYLFFDGSSLIEYIRALWRAKPELKSRKLYPLKLVKFLVSDAYIGLGSFVSNEPSNPGLQKRLPYKRAVFYFADGDSQIEKFLEMPDVRTPGLVKDINFRYCGRKIARSAEFDKWVEECVPEKFRDRVHRSEKGVDIQICCDTLQLAATGQIGRLFLLTNDSDFVPMCETVKCFGTNISLMQLPGRSVCSELVDACDGYYQVPENVLDSLFAR